MSLFQNSQRIVSAEVASTNSNGNVVWKVRLASGEVYLTEPTNALSRAVPQFVGSVVVITLKHNKITGLSRP